MRVKISESELISLIRKTLTEQEQTKFKPFTTSEYQNLIADVIVSCKSNQQTCAKTVSNILLNLEKTNQTESTAIKNLVSQKEGSGNKMKTSESMITEKCWKGYTQKGMKTMFGKKYPNCVKK